MRWSWIIGLVALIAILVIAFTGCRRNQVVRLLRQFWASFIDQVSGVWEVLCRWWHEDRPPTIIILLGMGTGIPGFFGALAMAYLWIEKQWPNHLSKWWPDFTKEVTDFRGAFGDFATILCLTLAAITWIHGRLLRLNRKLTDDLRRATQTVERTTLPALHSDLFAGLFAHWGGGFASGEHLKVLANGSKSYITIHSEVLYYTMLCSLLDSLRNSVKAICRAHVFIPGGASSLFLPEILKVLPERAGQSRYYIFRNDLLDYDRKSLRGKGDEHQLHLWSVFANASRVLFRDSGARFGYFKVCSPEQPSIWDDEFAWPDGYSATCERIRILQKGALPTITAIVQRNQVTFEFEQARIIVGDEAAAIQEATWPPTEAYFTKLKTHENHAAWKQAVEWEQYPLEVALVSGTEMELHARPDRTLWAVDDFALDDFDGPSGIDWQEMEWLKEGSPRYLAWSKSIAASHKRCTVYRLFLIDGTLLGGGTPQDEAKLLSLFSTMAIQHNYLSKQDRGKKRGEVRFLVKDDSVKVKKEYPDYCIIAKEGQIHGGVVWKPEPRYVTQRDTALLGHLQSLWNRAQLFTTGFGSVKGQLLAKKREIATAIARVEQLNDRNLQPFVEEAEEWLTSEILK